MNEQLACKMSKNLPDLYSYWVLNNKNPCQHCSLFKNNDCLKRINLENGEKDVSTLACGLVN